MADGKMGNATNSRLATEARAENRHRREKRKHNTNQYISYNNKEAVSSN